MARPANCLVSRTGTVVLSQKRIAELEAANEVATRGRSPKENRTQKGNIFVVMGIVRLTTSKEFNAHINEEKTKESARAATPKTLQTLQRSRTQLAHMETRCSKDSRRNWPIAILHYCIRWCCTVVYCRGFGGVLVNPGRGMQKLVGTLHYLDHLPGACICRLCVAFGAGDAVYIRTPPRTRFLTAGSYGDLRSCTFCSLSFEKEPHLSQGFISYIARLSAGNIDGRVGRECIILFIVSQLRSYKDHNTASIVIRCPAMLDLRHPVFAVLLLLLSLPCGCSIHRLGQLSYRLYSFCCQHFVQCCSRFQHPSFCFSELLFPFVVGLCSSRSLVP
jgi:hypothetical protein